MDWSSPGLWAPALRSSRVCRHSRLIPGFALYARPPPAGVVQAAGHGAQAGTRCQLWGLASAPQQPDSFSLHLRRVGMGYKLTPKNRCKGDVHGVILANSPLPDCILNTVVIPFLKMPLDFYCLTHSHLRISFFIPFAAFGANSIT